MIKKTIFLKALMSWQERKELTGQACLHIMGYAGSDYNNDYNVIKEIKDELVNMNREQQQKKKT